MAPGFTATAAAIGDRLDIWADGRNRSGTDVLRMLSLGAFGVLVGRPWVQALTVRGEAGILHLLSLLKAEMRLAMVLAGVADVDAHVIARICR
jgi:L-lactate dehydrogenase (cytochrome)